MQDKNVNLIREYERRLEENRIKINELNARVQEVQGELVSMSRQLEQIKNQQGVQQQGTQLQQMFQPAQQNVTPPYGQPIMPPSQLAPNQGTQPHGQPVMPQPQFVPNPGTQQQWQQIPQPPQGMQEQKKRDFEHVIGKSWMGIFASVLIFISLILFATLLTPYMTDTVKMVLMYVFSFSFTIAGLVCLRKYRNTTVVAITACGTGLVYLSLFMSHVYFKAYGELALFAFIFVWAVCVALLGKIRDKVFIYIGHLGILVSVIFGTVLCLSEADVQRLMILNIYYLVASSVLFVFTFKKEYVENMIHHCFSCASLVILSLGQLVSVENACGAGTVLLITLAVELLLVAVLRQNKISEFLGILLSLFAVMFISVEYSLLAETDVKDFLPGVIGIGICAYIIILLETKLSKQRFSKQFLKIVVLILLMVTGLTIDVISDNGLFLILIAIIYAVLGLIDKCDVYKLSGIVPFFIYMFAGEGELAKLILGMVFLALLYSGIWIFKNQYSKDVKVASYLMTLLYLLITSREIISLITDDTDVKNALPFLIISVLHIIVIKTVLSYNPHTGLEERSSRRAGYVVNALLMLAAFDMLDYMTGEICHFIIVLVAIALFSANSLNLLKSGKKYAGYYVGIKLTLLLIAILGSYHTPNAAISVASFVFAIACVVVGFLIKIKSIRMYGLILSIISIVKLVIVDISYDNTFSHAISYLVCGILCFVISMIYTYVDRKLMK
ncbi:MAG: DUF2339 domain-containing protein [Lachnospira sp.]